MRDAWQFSRNNCSFFDYRAVMINQFWLEQFHFKVIEIECDCAVRTEWSSSGERLANITTVCTTLNRETPNVLQLGRMKAYRQTPSSPYTQRPVARARCACAWLCVCVAL